MFHPIVKQGKQYGKQQQHIHNTYDGDVIQIFKSGKMLSIFWYLPA